MLTLKFLRSLITNFSFNKDSFLQLILPLFFGFIFGELNNEKNGECWKSRIYSSELIGFYYKKMEFRSPALYYKISKIFIKYILSEKENLFFIYGSFTGLSFLSDHELELVVSPHILCPNRLHDQKKKKGEFSFFSNSI